MEMILSMTMRSQGPELFNSGCNQKKFGKIAFPRDWENCKCVIN